MILNIKWPQIDFSRGFIKVEKAKSGKARAIPMNSLVESTLKKMEQEKENSGYVFWNTKTQKPIQDVKKGFKKACRSAGIKNLRFHDLKHNFASSLVENGVDIVTVSELLGHSDINITAKRYSHPSPNHKRQAVEALVMKKEEKLPDLLPEILPEQLPRGTN
jgi:site-specific recombinase XerD